MEDGVKPREPQADALWQKKKKKKKEVRPQLGSGAPWRQADIYRRVQEFRVHG